VASGPTLDVLERTHIFLAFFCLPFFGLVWYYFFFGRGGTSANISKASVAIFGFLAA